LILFSDWQVKKFPTSFTLTVHAKYFGHFMLKSLIVTHVKKECKVIVMLTENHMHIIMFNCILKFSSIVN
jgi:hypothetical protein